MGAFINVGLVASCNKQVFLASCEVLFNGFDNFMVLSGKYPENEDYNIWKMLEGDALTLGEWLDHCYTDCMAEILCRFTIFDYITDLVVVKIQHTENLHCLLLEIPDINPIFESIETAEEKILSFLTGDHCKNFLCAFCDCEADLYDMQGPFSFTPYAVFIKYQPLQVFLQNWRIDGITERAGQDKGTELLS